MQTHANPGNWPGKLTIEPEKPRKKDDSARTSEQSGPKGSPIRFALLWFAIPVAVLVLMAYFGR